MAKKLKSYQWRPVFIPIAYLRLEENSSPRFYFCKMINTRVSRTRRERVWTLRPEDYAQRTGILDASKWTSGEPVLKLVE